MPTVNTFPDADPGFHPAADIFPIMTDEEYAEFEEDIKMRGLMVPIVTTKDGLILDGRHRYRACMAAGIKPKYQVHTGDPWEYVISANLHRRHLTTGQRAMVADRLRTAVQGSGGPGRGQNEHKSVLVTRGNAAERFKISERVVHEAGVVRKKGVPELGETVDRGLVAIGTAKDVAEHGTEEEQKEFVRQVKAGVKPREAWPTNRPHLVAVTDDPPKKGRTRPTDNIRSSVFRKKDAEGLSAMVNGVTLAFTSITEVSGVDREQAELLDKEISKAKTVLNRIQKLLKEVE